MSAASPSQFPKIKFDTDFRGLASHHQVSVPQAITQDGETGHFFRRLDGVRFGNLHNLPRWEGINRTKERKVLFFEVVNKVIQVVTSCFMIFFALGLFYCPIWVPFGVMIPAMIALSIASIILKRRVQLYQREVEFVPQFQHLLNHPTIQELHPVGEYDHPAKDERLKSDNLAELELRKVYPTSAQNIEEAAGFKRRKKKELKYDVPDIDLTPYVQQHAACEMAGITEHTEKWRDVQAKTGAAKRECLQRNLKDFEKNTQQAFKVAYQWLNDVYFPSPSIKEQILASVKMYEGFVLMYPEVHQLYEKGKALYAPYTFLDEKTRIYPEWEEYVAYAQQCKEKIEQILWFLKKPDAQQPWYNKNDWECLLNEIAEAEIQHDLLDLIDQTGRMKHALQNWIDVHPESRLQNFKARCQKIQKEVVLDDKQFKQLAVWLKNHPKLCDHKIINIPESENFPKEILQWIEKGGERRRDLRFNTAADLFSRMRTIRHALFGPQLLKGALLQELKTWLDANPNEQNLNLLPQSISAAIKTSSVQFTTPRQLFQYASNPGVVGKLADLETEISESLKQASEEFLSLSDQAENKSLENFQNCSKKIGDFYKQVMVPLYECISVPSGTAKLRLWADLFLNTLPAKPFAQKTVPNESSPLQARTIEEIRLDRLLQDANQDMLTTNRARLWALRIPKVLFVALEGIFLVYFSSSWLFWGSTAFAVVLEGLSYYVDYRLSQKEKKKQSIKVQYTLRNHPHIDRVPGARPQIAALKEAQEKYGLEGVRPTWAKMLTEDKQKPFPQKKLAAEGSEQALHYLQNRLVILKSEHRDPDAKDPQFLEDKIQSIENTLSRVAPKEWRNSVHIPSDYERKVIVLEEVHAEKLAVKDKILFYEKRTREYQRNLVDMQRLEDKLKTLQSQKTIFAIQLQCLQQAGLGQTPESSQTDVLSILESVVNDVQAFEKSKDQKLKEFSEAFERLQGARKLTDNDSELKIIDSIEEAIKTFQADENALSLFYKLARVRKEYRKVWIARLNATMDSIENTQKEFEQKKMTEAAYSQSLARAFSELKPVPYTLLFLCIQTIKARQNALDGAQKQLDWYKNNKVYRSNEHKNTKDYFEDKLKECAQVLPELEKQLDALQQKYHEFSAALPETSLKSPIRTDFEKLEMILSGKTLKDDALSAIRTLYAALNIVEKNAIWWKLPLSFQRELNGERLYRFCKAHYEGELFWETHGQLIQDEFLKIDPQHHTNAFAMLPASVQDKLYPFYAALTGEDLLKRCLDIEKQSGNVETTRLQMWDQMKDEFETRFQYLDPYHQSRLYSAMPYPIRELFHPFYATITGTTLETICQRAHYKIAAIKDPAESKKAFDAWWKEEGDKISAAFQKVDNRYKARLLKYCQNPY